MSSRQTAAPVQPAMKNPLLYHYSNKNKLELNAAWAIKGNKDDLPHRSPIYRADAMPRRKTVAGRARTGVRAEARRLTGPWR
jgi:hypothetical protein